MTPLRVAAFAMGAALLAALPGCASQASPKPAAPLPADQAMPHVLTDLSSLSTGNFVPARKTTVAPVPISAVSPPAGAAKEESGPQLFLENPVTTIHVGTESSPGTETLLNAKAAKFPNFCRGMLDNVFFAAQRLEQGEVMTRLKLPEKMQPVILTAIMGGDGKLRELIVEQHSGEAYVDKLMIKACKTGLWTHNPPPEARGKDGLYRFRIEGNIENYTSHDGIWTFKTHLGMALL
jgi:hypothetical protein